MSHHTELGGPKWDDPDAVAQPTPSYDPSFTREGLASSSSYPVLPGRGQSSKPSPSTPSYSSPLSPYPQLSQPFGLTRPLPRMYSSRSPQRVFWKLRVIFWLVTLVIILYCLYYLFPFAHLAIFGITFHP